MKLTKQIGKVLGSLALMGAMSVSMAQLASAEKLEVGEVRSLGTEVKVPVTLYDFLYLQNMSFTVDAGANGQGIGLKGFQPAGIFDSSDFRTIYSVKGTQLKVDIISQSGKEVRLPSKSQLVGHVTYSVPASFQEGSSADLPIGTVIANGRAGADVIVDKMDGKIEKRMPVGDVVGANEPSAASAMRILQHINGNPISGKEKLLAADVDGDNVITQLDAQQILDYVTGKRTSFLAIRGKELDAAVMKSEYAEKVEAVHGRAPFTYTKTGTFPSGLKLDPATGEITGTPTGTRETEYKFTVKVTDATGNTADRQFILPLIDSNVIAAEKLLTINVKQNAVPELPAAVNVTYKDKTAGRERVDWEAVDTSVLGTVTAKGKTASGFSVNVQVNVVQADYVQDIQISYMSLFNLHTIQVTAVPEVYGATVNGIPMHFEGDSIFSLGTAEFQHNATVVLELTDKFGNILEQKAILLK